MNVTDFQFDLPERLIAQTPIQNRSASRLMVLDRKTGEIEHKHFYEILDYLNPGDALVLNNSKVLPARLFGQKKSGAVVEFLLLNRVEGNDWKCLAGPGKKAQPGDRFHFGDGKLAGEVLEIVEDGMRKVRFSYEGSFYTILDEIGNMPLPPYIKERLQDKSRYQTVYAKIPGSAAAPTAGLHFTPELLNKIKEKGVDVVYLTLHVGLGTFRPVKVKTVEEHVMHSEHFTVDSDAACRINAVKKSGGRVIAVGTTSCRTLETLADGDGFIKQAEGDTSIFIYPPYRFKTVDALITNFHLPESTLIMLVSALAGKENILSAYKTAVAEEYRFFSFGDAMFIK